MHVHTHTHTHTRHAQMKMTYLCQPLNSDSRLLDHISGDVTCFHADTGLSGLGLFCLSKVKWWHKGLYWTSI